MTRIATVNTPLDGPVLGRYTGSKWRQAAWISAYFPPHECYCEPFGGSAALLLQLFPPAPVEVYNDLDGQAVLFFRVLREQPDALAQAIAGTLWSRAEYQLAYQATSDPLEAARRFVVRAWQSRGGAATRWLSGWRQQRSTQRSGRYYLSDWWAVPERLLIVAERLRHVQIEHAPAPEVIARYDAPETLFYLDPPVPCQKPQASRLRCEMSLAEHQALATTLHQIQGMAVVSGYATSEYQTWYADFECVRLTPPTPSAQETECLYLSPQVTARAIQRLLF